MGLRKQHCPVWALSSYTHNASRNFPTNNLHFNFFSLAPSSNSSSLSHISPSPLPLSPPFTSPLSRPAILLNLVMLYIAPYIFSDTYPLNLSLEVAILGRGESDFASSSRAAEGWVSWARCNLYSLLCPSVRSVCPIWQVLLGAANRSSGHFAYISNHLSIKISFLFLFPFSGYISATFP